MSDTQSEQTLPPPPPKLIGRRHILQAFGLGSAIGFIGGANTVAQGVVNQPKAAESIPIQPEENLPSPTPEANLEAAGLSEFIPLYRLTNLFMEKWGVYPPMMEDIQIAIKKIAEGHPDAQKSDLYNFLTGDWGTHLAQSAEDVKQMLSAKQIHFGAEVDKETQKYIRDTIHKTFQAFPALAAVSAQTIEYGGNVALRCGYDAKKTPTLGCTDNTSYLHAGNKKGAEFVDTFVHECNHNLLDFFGRNPNVLKYLTKTDLVTYYTGSLALVDNFLTSIAQDTSEDPAEYTYGYRNWRDRTQTREKLAQYREALELHQEDTTPVASDSFTPLPEDPEYNLILKQTLKAVLNNTQIQGSLARNNSLLREFIQTEIGFIYHSLHSIYLDEKPTAGSNSNSIIQRFLDLRLEHQRLWMPLASGGKYSGTTSVDTLRGACNLPERQKEEPATENSKEKLEFSYEEFGYNTIREASSEFLKAKIFTLPDCPTDLSNNYFVIEISAVLQRRNKPHTIVFSLPRSISMSDCKFDCQENIATITLPDNTKISVNTSVITDTASPAYGSVGMSERQISTDNQDAQYLYAQPSIITRPAVNKIESVIGTVGPLDKQRKLKIHNVPGVAYTDLDNNLQTYSSPTDLEFAAGDILQLSGKDGHGACIINSVNEPKLFISSAPNTEYGTVDEISSQVKEFGASIIGEEKLRKFATKPQKLRIKQQLDTSDKATQSSVTASVVAEQNGIIRVYPIMSIE